MCICNLILRTGESLLKSGVVLFWGMDIDLLVMSCTSFPDSYNLTLSNVIYTSEASDLVEFIDLSVVTDPMTREP